MKKIALSILAAVLLMAVCGCNYVSVTNMTVNETVKAQEYAYNGEEPLELAQMFTLVGSGEAAATVTKISYEILAGAELVTLTDGVLTLAENAEQGYVIIRAESVSGHFLRGIVINVNNADADPALAEMIESIYDLNQPDQATVAE